MDKVLMNLLATGWLDTLLIAWTVAAGLGWMAYVRHSMPALRPLKRMNLRPDQARRLEFEQIRRMKRLTQCSSGSADSILSP